MILYLDTSALVKLYARELGSTEVKRAVARAGSVATSLVAYVETRSAFARKRRLADIDDAALRHTNANSSKTGPGSIACPSTRQRYAVREICRNDIDLRAYDALHLATADLFQAAVRSAVSFACFRRCAQRRRGGTGLEADCRRLTGCFARRSIRRRSSHDWPRCHISRAYSATARSLENAPIRARLSIAFRVQISGC